MALLSHIFLLFYVFLIHWISWYFGITMPVMFLQYDWLLCGVGDEIASRSNETRKSRAYMYGEWLKGSFLHAESDVKLAGWIIIIILLHTFWRAEMGLQCYLNHTSNDLFYIKINSNLDQLLFWNCIYTLVAPSNNLPWFVADLNSLRPSDTCYVGNLTIICSDNGLSPGRRQAIIWNNAGILLICPW